MKFKGRKKEGNSSCTEKGGKNTFVCQQSLSPKQQLTLGTSRAETWLWAELWSWQRESKGRRSSSLEPDHKGNITDLRAFKIIVVKRRKLPCGASRRPEGTPRPLLIPVFSWADSSYSFSSRSCDFMVKSETFQPIKVVWCVKRQQFLSFSDYRNETLAYGCMSTVYVSQVKCSHKQCSHHDSSHCVSWEHFYGPGGKAQARGCCAGDETASWQCNICFLAVRKATQYRGSKVPWFPVTLCLINRSCCPLNSSTVLGCIVDCMGVFVSLVVVGGGWVGGWGRYYCI